MPSSRKRGIEMPSWFCHYCCKPVTPTNEARLIVAQMFDPDETTYSHRVCWEEYERKKGREPQPELRSGQERRKGGALR